jgi:glutamate racemase
LRSVIRQAIGDSVQLIDPAHDTAAELAAFLKQDSALDAEMRTVGPHEFYVSDRTDRFEALAREWLGTEVNVCAATAERS